MSKKTGGASRRQCGKVNLLRRAHGQEPRPRPPLSPDPPWFVPSSSVSLFLLDRGHQPRQGSSVCCSQVITVGLRIGCQYVDCLRSYMSVRAGSDSCNNAPDRPPPAPVSRAYTHPTAHRARPWRSRPWTAPYPGLPHRQSVSIPPAPDGSDARPAVYATITPSAGATLGLQE